VIVPLSDTGEQEPRPELVTVYGNDPLAVGVPLMTKVEPDTAPVMPDGREPEVILAEVAPPPKVYTVFGLSVVLWQKLGLADPPVRLMVCVAYTVIVPLRDWGEQLPVPDVVTV
jgi:hypothetical protein